MLLANWLLVAGAALAAGEAPTARVAQLVGGQALFRRNPEALPSLLREIAKVTTLAVDDQPVVIQSFEDPIIFECPFIFVNFGDRQDWTFSALESRNLRDWLRRGGFLYIDAGITSEFLRGDRQLGQRHSFGDWEASPELREAFKSVFPDLSFRPLPRSHELYRTFYRGLPDTAILPDTVRDYVIQEKWPDGTYAAVGLHLDGRVAVLATPIVSMGWGRNAVGGWSSTISFRIRESAAGLSERLATASYGGERFEAAREDGRRDVIYCQQPGLPAWSEEPDGNFRIFRYYHSREISDYAHTFFTRLGVNIFVYALTY